jgi:hypothetical protein
VKGLPVFSDVGIIRVLSVVPFVAAISAGLGHIVRKRDLSKEPAGRPACGSSANNDAILGQGGKNSQAQVFVKESTLFKIHPEWKVNQHHHQQQ